MDDILDKIMDLLGCLNTSGFQHFGYDQGCTSSLDTFHQLDGLNHQLKWDWASRCCCWWWWWWWWWWLGWVGVVKLFERRSYCYIQAARLAVSSRYTFPASLQTYFSPWTSGVSHPIWGIIVRTAYLRILEDFCLRFCQITCLVRRLAFWYSSLLPLFQVFQHLPVSLTTVSTAAIHHLVSFYHKCYLVYPHTFSVAFSKLDRHQVLRRETNFLVGQGRQHRKYRPTDGMAWRSPRQW